LPDLRDLIHVAGWTAMAFRYLSFAEARTKGEARAEGEALTEASHMADTTIPAAQPQVFEADCTFRGQRMRLRETATDLLVFTEDQLRYHWRKGEPWPRLAREEFWLQ
jgi:hypothetical protein